MEFGKLDNIDSVDWTLPVDDLMTIEFSEMAFEVFKKEGFSDVPSIKHTGPIALF